MKSNERCLTEDYRHWCLDLSTRRNIRVVHFQVGCFCDLRKHSSSARKLMVLRLTLGLLSICSSCMISPQVECPDQNFTWIDWLNNLVAGYWIHIYTFIAVYIANLTSRVLIKAPKVSTAVCLKTQLLRHALRATMCSHVWFEWACMSLPLTHRLPEHRFLDSVHWECWKSL